MPVNKNQLGRLQTILKMMRQNRYPNSTTLIEEMAKQDVAGAYELSAKTFSRDIKYLRDACGAPIQYDSSRKGFFLTNPEWYNEELMVEPFEMKAALLGERIASGILPGPMQARINDAISALLMKNESGMAEGVELENFRVYSQDNLPKVDPEIFMTAYNAWEQHRLLKIIYKTSKSKISEKVLEPYIFAWKNGSWYIKGRIHKDDATSYEDVKIQVLALHRMEKIQMSGTFFPDTLVLNKLKKSALFNFEKLPEADLEFFSPADVLIAERFEKHVVERTENSVRLVIKNDITEYDAVDLILSARGNFKIHSPESLREKLREIALKMLENLGD